MTQDRSEAIAAELRIAATAADRLLAEVAGALDIPGQFEVIRGTSPPAPRSAAAMTLWFSCRRDRWPTSAQPGGHHARDPRPRMLLAPR